MGPRVNQKAVAAKEKKAANKAAKDAEAARKAEATEAAEWKKGSNVRAASRAEAAANKADEAARKKREKAALLAAEEEATGSGKPVKSAHGAASKKKGAKKKDGLALLEETLVGNAEKKAKEKKKMERLKKEREEKLAAERERKAKEERVKKDPLLANTEAMIGMDGPTDEDGVVAPKAVGRAANVASMSDVHATGLDSAISALSMGEGGDDRHPEKRMKALHKAFEEKMMPEMKEQYPGLKRQQYLDKIFALWKKSPENPMNQMQAES